MSKLFVNKENVADNSNSITFRKQLVNGTVDLAHDCNKTGYYWIDAILKDPIPPYEGTDSSARFVVHTIAHDYKNASFRYQEVIFDGGKYYRASWQGDDHYTSWSTEVASNLNLDLLASRISALEKQIGGYSLAYILSFVASSRDWRWRNMTQLFISGNPALTPDQLTTRNLLDNSKQIIVDGTNANEDFWTAIPIGKSIPINTHLTVSFQSVMYEDVVIYGGSTYKERFNSIDHDNPTDWCNIVENVKQSYTNNCKIQTFNVIENLPYAYLVLWSGKSMQYVKQILSNVMVQFGDKATVWTPSLHDMGIPTLDDFNELKSHLGGVKPSYRLYYATSVKEVA